MDFSRYYAIANRQWQKEALHKAHNSFSVGNQRFMLAAAPGAGKTRCAVAITRLLFDSRMIDQVVVVSPREKITTQWRDAFSSAGLHVASLKTLNEMRPGERFSLSITWSAVGAQQLKLADLIRSARTLVILDELHHAARGQTWGDAAVYAFDSAQYVMKLSGTPFRSDGNRIIWLDYNDAEQVLIPEEQAYILGYRAAIEGGYCRAVGFDRWEPSGGIEVINGVTGETRSYDTTADMTKKEASAVRERLLGMREDADDGPYRQFLTAAHRHLLDQRRDADEHAGGLVVCKSIPHAQRTAKLLEEITGEKPVVVNCRIEESSQLIEDFEVSSQMWLVSVSMVSEGTDVPRLRVLAWATNVSTELNFRQVIGRIVRKRHESRTDRSDSICLLPNFAPWNEYALRIEEEIGYVRAAPKPEEPPTEEPPTEEPPTEEPPTEEPPTEEPPTVEPPTVEPPTVEPPTVEPPTVEPPTVEPPTVEPPGGGRRPIDPPPPPPPPPQSRWTFVIGGAERNGGTYRGDEFDEEHVLIGERIREEKLKNAKSPSKRRQIALITAYGWYLMEATE
jgi:superfamily II DNA or RNA helicase